MVDAVVGDGPSELYIPLGRHSPHARAILAAAIEHNRRFVDHVGFGGKTRVIETEMELGRGVWRTPPYGLRRAVWDAAFGYVSGFRKRDMHHSSRRSPRRWISRSANIPNVDVSVDGPEG